MLYPKNQTEKLSDELFQNPTAEYRSTPFWAWNGKLNEEDLGRQIDLFKRMGFGGAHLHVRTGLDTPYLTEEYMHYIRFCLDRFKGHEMLTWLYDEDRWPSGAAGGKVTGPHPEYAQKKLLLTRTPYAPDRPNQPHGSEPGRGHRVLRQDNGELLAVYDIVLTEDCRLKSWKIVPPDAPAEEGTVRWYAYMEHATADPWFNDCPYVDTLNKDAIAEFIRITHEAYFREFHEEFGRNIPSIFTDEPQFVPKTALAFAGDDQDIVLPWTEALPDLYQKAYGSPLLQDLPELFWEKESGEKSAVRWQFSNTLANRFVDSFCEQIGSWCRNHDIALTGHLMGEQTLESQTKAVGDAMRCYPGFGIPGIDILCDHHEFNTAKQTASMVHQSGAEGMLSELYGVTGWEYDFRGYKLQGDWQAALGVTVRVPHLAWMSMKGEAKRDYPACIGEQSPWAEEYAMVEDHFARLNTALTRGRADVRIAVVHPIESFWLLWGPVDQTESMRARMEAEFAGLTETLLMNQLDFDFLCESTLPSQTALQQEDGRLCVGKMRYDAVIIPSVLTLRDTTVDILTKFAQRGGRILTLGSCPEYINARPSHKAEALYAFTTPVLLDAFSLSQALSEERFLKIQSITGKTAEEVGAHLLYQHRMDQEDEWLFICNGKNPICPDVEPAPTLRFALRGEYCVELYDTADGTICPFEVTVKDGWTHFERKWYMHDSLLLHLTALQKDRNTENTAASPLADSLRIKNLAHSSISEDPLKDVRTGRVPVSYSESNMLLLDRAEYAMDDSEWYAEDEILRIDNEARRQLGIPLRRKDVVQPYCLKEEKNEHVLRLRCTIPSEIETEVFLALEDRETTRIFFNGAPVTACAEGFFVDRCIRKVRLGKTMIGNNVLEIEAPIGKRTNQEPMYLLGEFGVQLCGTTKILVPLRRELGFSDICMQGLPFYTGNITYHLKVYAEGDFILRVPNYRGGLIKVLLDGQEAGRIAFSPYQILLHASKGPHDVDLILYGLRYNGFAQLHHTQGVYFYKSPNSWRSDGDLWNDSYTLFPMGILKSPETKGAFLLDEAGKIRRIPGKKETSIRDIDEMARPKL